MSLFFSTWVAPWPIRIHCKTFLSLLCEATFVIKPMSLCVEGPGQFHWSIWLSLGHIWSSLSHALNHYSFIRVLMSVKHVLPFFRLQDYPWPFALASMDFRIRVSYPSCHDSGHKRPGRFGLGWHGAYASAWGTCHLSKTEFSRPLPHTTRTHISPGWVAHLNVQGF